MYTISADVYDAVHDFKDYRTEAKDIIRIIGREHPRARTLLDVACGTGRHLEFLAQYFVVEGVDSNSAFLERAKLRCLGIPLHLQDMASLDLKHKFDAITILFSSIVCTKTLPRLNQTIHSMARHLQPGGIVLVEPFFDIENYRYPTITANFVDKPDLKIAWMYTSRRAGRVGILDMKYMVGTKAGVDIIDERHELGLFDRNDYLQAFQDAGLLTDYSNDGPCGRGLFIGRKRID
jgi:ubiquinone/menaquinone biosynthesis C-methylase UbiE